MRLMRFKWQGLPNDWLCWGMENGNGKAGASSRTRDRAVFVFVSEVKGFIQSLNSKSETDSKVDARNGTRYYPRVED